MPYQYGMQNSPSGGNGLGGLPKKQTTPTRVSFTRIVTAGSGVIVPPANAKYMRVAVVGGGGGGNAAFAVGGSGGGCAASKITPAVPIQYTVGAAATDSTANFLNYSLIARGGRLATAGVTNPGGTASGGDYNYTGGSGENGGSAGGAAGPCGNGANGIFATGSGLSATVANSGWGVAGGGSAGLIASGGVFVAASGGGTGASGGSPEQTTRVGGDSLMWGTKGGDHKGTLAPGPGGVMGGGGGYYNDGAGFLVSATGGVGGIVVEWFYD